MILHNEAKSGGKRGAKMPIQYMDWWRVDSVAQNYTFELHILNAHICTLYSMSIRECSEWIVSSLPVRLSPFASCSNCRLRFRRHRPSFFDHHRKDFPSKPTIPYIQHIPSLCLKVPVQTVTIAKVFAPYTPDANILFAAWQRLCTIFIITTTTAHCTHIVHVKCTNLVGGDTDTQFRLSAYSVLSENCSGWGWGVGGNGDHTIETRCPRCSTIIHPRTPIIISFVEWHIA